MKKIVAVIMLAMSVILASCGGEERQRADAKVYTLRINIVLKESDPIFIALRDVFKKNVEERTQGRLIVDIFSGGQLGTDEDVMEQAMVGYAVGALTDPGRLGNYVYDFSVLQAPYIVESYQEALRLFETETYRQLLAQLQEKGFHVLSFNYFQGERELFTKSPVARPADLKGQRIRSSGSAIVSQTLKDMGANITVLAWSEAYQALQQKVVEGVEVHLSAALGASIYEVTDYLTMTGHQQLLTALVVSNKWFHELPPEYQQILSEESFRAGTAASEMILSKQDDYYQQLQDKGIEVVEVDKAAFIKATENTYDVLNLRTIKDQIDKELGRQE